MFIHNISLKHNRETTASNLFQASLHLQFLETTFYIPIVLLHNLYILHILIVYTLLLLLLFLFFCFPNKL